MAMASTVAALGALNMSDGSQGPQALSAPAAATDVPPAQAVSKAFGFGCGAVLLQNQKPIAFHSYKLSDAERRYFAGEQELLAVISALS